ncbi:MAG: dinitrogenase iron-molybdenum cofactor biosynthesis protein [Desulfuromonadales bacterium]|nr:dinitrogenase iron-molybdenum cofactor biosynthesis protein [Desulfuromonadales bacterium]
MKKSIGIFLALVLMVFFTFTAFAADPAKIAVAAEGNTPSAQVSAVAARCPYFLLFDGQGTLVEVLANPHRDASGGAGSKAVQFLAGKGVTDVIAGAFGPKMVGALQAEGMRYLEFKGSAADAVKQALKK